MGRDLTDIGHKIKTVGFLAPQALSGSSEVLTSAIDTQAAGFVSGQLIATVGATTGTPTAASIALSLKHCATSGGSYTVFTPGETNVATTLTLATTDTTARAINVDLRGAERYLKISATPTFTGGSSPSTLVSAQLVGVNSTTPTSVS